MIAMNVSTTIKIDSELKRDAQVFLDEFGLSLSAAVTLFLRQVVREQAIPFRIGSPKPPLVYTEEEYRKKLERGLEDIHAGRGIHKTLEELMEMEGNDPE